MMSVQLNPLWLLGFQAIYNISDNSAFMSVSAEFNVSEDIYLDFGYYHFTGDNVERANANTNTLKLASEYGFNPDVLYTSFRYYF